ncbi:adenylate kinase [Devosia nitrariae]|uniref:Adenylate kinase n=1 Tax=Devosia nitrariae TaxID=2071872 RepID=A0ABQ5WAS0_9HYPH|nr:adenylate kinase [Devosia nitrariae]GLQ57171.1 adenylate kinase [Devosia nitrariae]
MVRIHVLGASGAGTSTLGAAVADALAVPHLDTDNFYWLPTDPPFTSPRPREERISMLMDRIAFETGWVLSGSAIGWAQPLEPLYDLVAYVWLDPSIRMARLREREQKRYGQRIARGGDLEGAHAEFLAWAARYDTAGLEQRSRAAHEAWLAKQEAPVIRLDASRPVNDLVIEVLAAAGSSQH